MFQLKEQKRGIKLQPREKEWAWWIALQINSFLQKKKQQHTLLPVSIQEFLKKNDELDEEALAGAKVCGDSRYNQSMRSNRSWRQARRAERQTVKAAGIVLSQYSTQNRNRRRDFIFMLFYCERCKSGGCHQYAPKLNWSQIRFMRSDTHTVLPDHHSAQVVL